MPRVCCQACRKLKTSESACFAVAARHAENPKQVKMHALQLPPGMQKNQNKSICMLCRCGQACRKIKKERMHASKLLPGMQKTQNKSICMLRSCCRACRKLKTSESACFEVAAGHAENPKQVNLHASKLLPGMQKIQNK